MSSSSLRFMAAFSSCSWLEIREMKSPRMLMKMNTITTMMIYCEMILS